MMTMNRSAAVETERLILRRFRQEDEAALGRMLSDPVTVEFEPYEPMTPPQVAEALRWRISTEEMIAVELRNTGELIGNVYLGKRDFDTLELGYLFSREHWGRGFARESCDALIRGAFASGVHRICAQCDPENGRSMALLRRLGFRQEGLLRKNVFFRRDGRGEPVWQDTALFGMLNGEKP